MGILKNHREIHKTKKGKNKINRRWESYEYLEMLVVIHTTTNYSLMRDINMNFDFFYSNNRNLVLGGKHISGLHQN